MGLFSYAVLRLAKSVTDDSQQRRERLRTMPGASRTTTLVYPLPPKPLPPER